jgi:IgA Peptidase M64
MPSAPGAAMLDRKLFITRTAEPWRNLYERWWDGEEWLWVDHGRPEGVPVRSAPGAAMLDQKLFVVVEDGRLFERHWRADLGRWAWEDHGRPGNERIVSHPGAAMMDEKLFVVTEAGGLWERHWRADLGRWAWQDHGRPPGSHCATAPGAPMLDQKLFVGGANGRLYERFWDGTAWVWVDHGSPPDAGVASAPSAAMADTKLFVQGSTGRLHERFWDGTAWVWVDHGSPPGAGVASAPSAAMADTKLFVQGSTGRLHERFWDGTAWVWVDHGSPPGATVTTAAGAAMMNSKLFVGTSNERLFERLWNGAAWVWVDHGTLLHDSRATLLGGDALTRTIAVLGDGFTEADLGQYTGYVQRELIDGVFGNDVFAEMRSAFTVIRVDLVSVDSGVSQRRYDEQGTPNDASDDTIASETLRNTRLGYIFSGSWAHCWMEPSGITNRRITKALDRFAPDADFVVVALNEGGFGGCARGTVQAVTRGVDWTVIAHEFGHTIGGLSDEYTRAGRTFTGTAWGGPNCSITAARAALPWSDLVDAATPLPTNPVPAGWNANTDVGAFEGCGTFETSLFRPVLECRMNQNSPPFCPVCARSLRALLTPIG